MTEAPIEVIGEINLSTALPDKPEDTLTMTLRFPEGFGLYASDVLSGFELDTRPEFMNGIAAALIAEGSFPPDFDIASVVGEDGAADLKVTADAARATFEGDRQTFTFDVEAQRPGIAVTVTVGVEFDFPAGEGLSMLVATTHFADQNLGVLQNLLAEGDRSTVEAYAATQP